MKYIRGYWDCNYCNTKAIDGLMDNCTNCGKQKPSDTKYYMLSENDFVSAEELNKAKIRQEDCDGKHTDWVCDYCGQLNNYTDNICVACGGSKDDATKLYGGVQANKLETNVNADSDKASDKNDITIDNKECNVNDREWTNEVVSKDTIENGVSNIEKSDNTFGGYINNWLNVIIGFVCRHKLGMLISSFILLLIVLLFPYNVQSTVTRFTWERTVVIEDYLTFNESDWSLPSGARIRYTNNEIHHYEDVLDHYETKTRQCSRQVFDGYDTITNYVDAGNGVFVPETTQTARYRTEYYTEDYQEPVYREEPIYKTKYYYEIDRWTAIDRIVSSGNDHKPYWSSDYTLKDGDRDTTRLEEYNLIFKDSKDGKDKSNKVTVDYDKFMDSNIGDTITLTKCLLGIVYNTKERGNVL